MSGKAKPPVTIATAVHVLRALSAPEKQGFLQLAKELAGGAAAFTQRVRAAVETIDQGALLEEELSRYQWAVWDDEMPINGVPAEVVRARHAMGEQDGAYWIARDGQIFIFQPVKGVRDTAQLAALAEQHVREIAEDAVRWRVIDMVEEQLLSE